MSSRKISNMLAFASHIILVFFRTITRRIIDIKFCLHYLNSAVSFLTLSKASVLASQ